MKNYFNFSKGQKIGVTVLAIIAITQIIVLNKGSEINISDPFSVSTQQYNDIEKSLRNNKKDYKKLNKEYSLSKFNPNEFKKSDWKKIGFSDKQSNIIVNYKNRIGGFKRNSDVEKVFVINEKKYKEIEPYLEIQNVDNNTSNYINNFKKQEVLIIYELNSATFNELVTIKGVGEFTAKAILKQKKLIGGFHSIIQLMEVYGIEERNYLTIKEQLSIDDSKLIKINVNNLSIFELKKEHYISWNIAEAIINKRLMGKLSNIDFLVDDKVISKEQYQILVPYIEY